MYTIYLCAFIGLIAGLVYAHRDNLSYPPKYRSIGPYFAGAIVGPVIGAIVGAVVALIFVASFVPMRTVTYGPVKLAAMRSADGMNGAFVWGTGSVSNQVSYNFYIRNDDGSLTPGQVPANSVVRIVEEESLKDEGYWTITRTEKDRSSPFAPWSVGLNDSTRILKQEFRVPAGTVVQSFKVQ